jgi:MFS-type transporter involved in bile tolerance (Atg22 family)
VSVSYLKEALEFNGTQIGIMFFIVIISTIPGSLLGAFVTYQTSPPTSMKLQLTFFIIVNFFAFTVMTEAGHQGIAYYFGILWGISLGKFVRVCKLYFLLVENKYISHIKFVSRLVLSN